MKKQRIRLPRRDGLVAEYLLNGNTNDTSGNGYDGTPLNVTYSKTDRGYQTYAGNFNGSNSKVDLPTLPSLSDFSVSFWCTGSTNAYKCAFALGNSTNNANVEIRFYNSKIDFVTYDGNAVGYFTSNTTFESGKYYHIVAYRSGLTGYLYVNGQYDSSGSVRTMSTGTDRCSIGYIATNNSSYYDGIVQSVRVFNRVLSQDEIRDWYLEGLRALGGSSLSGLMDGLVAYYDFRGDANDIISGYDGTVNGATLTTDRFGTANSAYSFNGSSYIGVTSTSALQLTSNYTIICDIEAGTNPGTDSCILGKDSNTGERAYYFAAYPVFASTKFTFYIGGTGNGYVNSTTNVANGTKYVIAGSHTGSQLKIYVDGVNEATSSASATPTGNSELQIGARQYSGARQFYNGKIYRVLIFNVLKTDAEIATITKLLQNGILLPFA